jgi:hypothetical protein
MADKSSNSSGGIGFCGMLAILFIGLKLTGHVAWSWWWVLSPLWIPFALVLGVFTVLGLGFLIGAIFSSKPRRPRQWWERVR